MRPAPRDDAAPAVEPAGELAPVPLPFTRRRVPHAFRALGFRDFRLFWTGAVLSNVGSHMQMAALAWVVAVQTRSALRVTAIAFVAMFPLFLLGPIGGALADRFPRRRVLVVTQSVHLTLAFLLFGLWQAGLGSYWVLFFLALTVGIVGAINAPAWQAFVPELVPRKALQNAVMLNSTQFNIARAVGPMMAGFILAQFGAGICFLLNALSFVAVLAGLLLMAPRKGHAPPARTGFWSEFVEGIRYVRGERGLVTGIATLGVIVLLGAPIIYLIPILALEAFEVAEIGYGLLAGAFGLGAIVGAILVGRADERLAPSRMIVAGMTLYVAAIATLGSAPVLALGIVAMVGVGAGFLTIASNINSSIQTLCDDRLRGRVMSLWLMTFGMLFPLGVILQGAISDAVGPRAVVVGDAALIGAYLMLVTSRGLLTSLDPPEARRADRGVPLAAPEGTPTT